MNPAIQDWSTRPDGLASQLRIMRQRAHLAGKELAALLGWRPEKVSRVERGRRLPTAGDIEVWAKACGGEEAVDRLIDLLSEVHAARVVHRAEGNAPQARARVVRFLHWNVHSWVDADGVDNVSRVVDVIGDERPDFLSLVEVGEPWGRPVKLQQVAEQLGYHWAYVPAFEHRAGGFGNALLSLEPFGSVQQWQLLPPSLYDGSEPSEPRSCVLATVSAGGAPLTIGSTHFPARQASSRRQASARLLDLLDQVDGAFMVFGDFNQPPSAWLDESLTVVPSPPVATYPADDPREPIDYCLVRGLDVEGAVVLASGGSDHRPVLVTSRSTASVRV